MIIAPPVALTTPSVCRATHFEPLFSATMDPLTFVGPAERTSIEPEPSSFADPHAVKASSSLTLFSRTAILRSCSDTATPDGRVCPVTSGLEPRAATVSSLMLIA